jgi:hypothetical protein
MPVHFYEAEIFALISPPVGSKITLIIDKNIDYFARILYHSLNKGKVMKSLFLLGLLFTSGITQAAEMSFSVSGGVAFYNSTSAYLTTTDGKAIVMLKCDAGDDTAQVAVGKVEGNDWIFEPTSIAQKVCQSIVDSIPNLPGKTPQKPWSSITFSFGDGGELENARIQYPSGS